MANDDSVIIREDNYKVIVFTEMSHLDPNNDNVDFELVFDSGERYSGWFFTLSNVESLMEKFQVEGDCNNGNYFWATDMVILRQLTLQDMADTIRDLNETGDYVSAFSLLNDE